MTGNVAPGGPGRGGARSRQLTTVVDEAAVADHDDPIRPAGEAGLVGDYHAGGTLVDTFAEDTQDGVTRGGVQRTGRLVGQQDATLADQRAGDGGPLGLTAGDLLREAVVEPPRGRPPGTPRDCARRARAAGRRSPRR